MPLAGIGIGLGTALAGGAAAGATIYGSSKQSASNDRASAATREANDRATALTMQAEANRKSEFDQQQVEAKRQWDATEANRAPYRAASQDALMRVRDLLGLPAGSVASASGGSPSGAPAASPMAGSAADLKALIDSGLDPQSAAQAFNQKFKRTTGNEAKYYDPSQHGGVATIGLPDAYLSQEPNGWAITPRGGGGGAAPRVAPMVNPSFMAPGTELNYNPVIPMSQLMRGVR